MNRQEKSAVVELLRNSFENNQACFIVGYQGIPVDKMQELRKNLRRSGGELKVAKGRLMKRAAGQVTKAHELVDGCKGQIGLVFASDVTAVAKALHDFSANNEALKLVQGCLDARLLSKQDIVRLAKMPSKQVLLAQLCGTLNAPLGNFMRILHMLNIRLLLVLKQIADQKGR